MIVFIPKLSCHRSMQMTICLADKTPRIRKNPSALEKRPYSLETDRHL